MGKKIEFLINIIVMIRNRDKDRVMFSVSVRCKAVSYTHLRAHETGRNLVCRLLLEKKKKKKKKKK